MSGIKAGLAVALVIWLFSGCSGGPKPSALEQVTSAFDGLRTAVRKEVRDPAKAEELAGLVGQLEKVLIEAVEARKAHIARLRGLNANYDATENEFKALFADYDAQQQVRQDRLLVIDQRGHEITTKDEWKVLSRDVVHALDASAKAELGL